MPCRKKYVPCFSGSLPAAVVVNVCSLLLAAIFIFSGFTKAVDPVGGAVKLQEYLAAFGVSSFGFETVLAVCSIIESTVEFMLGVNLLLGTNRRIVSRLTLAVMVFMTALTLYIAVTGAVSECGCFGDAVHLGNWQTFAKNVVLLAASVVVAVFHGRVWRLYAGANEWLAQAYSFVFIVVVSLYSYYYLPLIDYRPYRIGQDINKAMEIPRDAEAPEFETTFILEKNGRREEFSLDNYPDSTWKFVDSKTVVKKHGFRPEISDFALFSTDGEDVTREVLSDGKYSFWVVMPRIENTDNGVIDAIEDIYDYCRLYGYAMYGITASDSEKAMNWCRTAGMRIRFLSADETVLKTMIRSNPGVVLVKDGKILNKWGKNELPDEEKLVAKLEKLPLAYGKSSFGIKQTLIYLMLFFVPLIILIFAGKIRAKRIGKQHKD